MIITIGSILGGTLFRKLTAFQYFRPFFFSQILPRLFTPNKARRIYGWLRSGRYDGM